MYKKYIKRLFDILLVLIFIPFFFLLLIPIYILIKIEDRGPILYAGKRVGEDGEVYKMYKFRTMKANAPDIRNEDGSTYNSSEDNRVTKVGKLLRETSIDEIPQIINVLKGEMSIIGPRPGLPDLVSSYKEDELDKLKVRPGITGYTQAYYRNGLSSRGKRIKDSWYANNLTLWLDIKIFLKTILTVIKKEGLYTQSDNKEVIKKKQSM